MMNEKLHSSLGRVCGICLVLIVLGSLAAWQLYGIFTKKSEIHGTSKVIDYIDEENNIILNEDETIFFSYAFSQFVFENKDNVYSQKLILEKLKYTPEDKGYDVYVNANKALVVKEPGRISATFPFSFQTGGADKYQAVLNIVVTFFNDRTELTLSFTDKKLSGYLNQMAKMGFVVKITEKPLESTDNGNFEDRPEDEFKYKYLVSDGFKAGGSWQYEYKDVITFPKGTFIAASPTYSWSVIDRYSILEGNTIAFSGKINGNDLKSIDDELGGTMIRRENKLVWATNGMMVLTFDFIFVGPVGVGDLYLYLTKDIESNMLTITLQPLIDMGEYAMGNFMYLKEWWEKNVNKEFVKLFDIELYINSFELYASPA